jgi:Flp pilus assembly protein CpaB
LRTIAVARGATLVSAVRRGELITDVRLLGSGSLERLGPGLVAAPVRIADPESAGLLRPGSVVDVLAAGAADGASAGEARLVAAAVRVLTVPRAPGRGLGASVGEGALVLVATTSSTAQRLAGAAVAERLSVVVRR